MIASLCSFESKDENFEVPFSLNFDLLKLNLDLAQMHLILSGFNIGSFNQAVSFRFNIIVV